MSRIIPEEEFAKRFKKPRFMSQVDNDDQYFEKYATKVGNEYMTKTTFNDLLNKVDLVLKNQEVIMDLLAEHNITSTSEDKEPNKNNVSRRVYKELVNNRRKIQVGCVLPFSQILEFNKPRDIANHSSFTKNLNVYYPEFYVEDVSDNGSVYNLFKPSNDIIEIVDKSRDKYCVTGFLIDDGRAVYYDQYL